MKHLCILFSVLFISVNCFSQVNTPQKFKKPEQYDSYIMDIVDQMERGFYDIMDEDDDTKNKPLVDSFAVYTKRYVIQLSSLSSYKKDNSLRAAALEFAIFMDRIAKKEIPEFMKLIFSDDILSTKSQNRLDELVPLLDDKRTQLFDQVKEVRKTFAKKFKYTITDQ